MDRYIATVDLATLAAEYQVTEEQVLQFIQTERTSGRIDGVYQYVNANPGATVADVAANVAGGFDEMTAGRILRLLEFAGWIVKF